jgi:cysteine desulfurase/selenocysteine lyase
VSEEAAAPRPAAVLAAARIRDQFPILRERVHGKPLVYLDNAATTHKPRAVIDAVTRFYEHDNSNVHRGLHELAARATHAYEAARDAVAELVSAPDRREIVFTRGTTEGINLVAHALGDALVGPGDEILVTAMEHHSNIVPWQLLCERRGARLRVAPIDDAGDVIVPEFAALLGPRTRIASFVHVSNALGTVNTVKELAALARANGTLVVVDGAQAMAHRRVDVADLGCDFYAFSSHKMYGPTGIGALWGRYDLLRSMAPFQGGGEMIRTVRFEGSTYADPPHRFEAGTPNIAGAVGFGAAARWLGSLDRDAVEAAERELLELAAAGLRGIPRAHLVGTPRERSGAVSFRLDGIHPHDAGTILDHEGIAVRAGHHCAQPVMERYGVPATIRASFACYNVREEVAALVAGVRRVIEVLG